VSDAPLGIVDGGETLLDLCISDFGRMGHKLSLSPRRGLFRL
jgi:hypothetical protein